MAIAELTQEYLSTAAYGLAPMQAGMLFQGLLEADGGKNGVNVEQVHIVTDEWIALREVGQAWAAIVRRHTALSSSFRWQGVRAPGQQPNLDAVVPRCTEDWRGLDNARRAQRLDAFLARQRLRPRGCRWLSRVVLEAAITEGDRVAP